MFSILGYILINFITDRIIHESGYSKEECLQYRPVVHSNTIQSLIAIIKAMGQLRIDFKDPNNIEAAKKFISMVGSSIEGDINIELARIMKKLWRDSGVQLCFSRAREYQLNDSAQ